MAETIQLPACSVPVIADVEIAVAGTAIDGEGEAVFLAVGFQPAHIDHIETDLDETGVAPLTGLFENLTGFAVHGLHQLYHTISVEVLERSLEGFGTGKQHSAIVLDTAAERLPVAESAGFVINHGIVTEYTAIEFH